MKPAWLLAWAAIPWGGPLWAAKDSYPISVPVPRGAEKPVHNQFKVTARDGTRLVVHEWAPKPLPKKKPVVLFIHGIAMHGRPYGAVAAGFTSKGIAFVVPDLRGHGRSGGNRGDLARPHVLRSDLGQVIGLIHRRHPRAPVILAGESMGGLLAADYAWQGERRLAGLALLAPAFAVHPSLKGDFLREASNALVQGKVTLVTPAKLKASSRDPGFCKARLADKVALPGVKVSYLLTIGAMQKWWPGSATEIKIPLFVGVAGKDQIVNNKTVRQIFDRAATPKTNKTWKQWDAASHTLCWDPVTPKVVGALAEWALKCSR
jgi:alpha-beta hydrolase superfamily lysophospholipase